MNYIWFLTIVVLIVVVVISLCSEELLQGILAGCITAVFGLAIMGINVQGVNYKNVKNTLEIIVNENISDEDLESEIKNLIKDESDNKVNDVIISVESSEVNDIKLKKVSVKMKCPVIFNGLYIKEDVSFKLFIKKIESGEYITQVVGI